MQSFVFQLPPFILFGPDMWKRVGAEAKRLGGKKALIIADQFLVTGGQAQRMQEVLASEGVEAVVYDKGMAEPTDAHVQEGLSILRQAGCNLLIGFGGGSALDTAKAVALMATNPGAISDYMGANKVKMDRLPLIAVNTTAGTGSEVTKFTIITDTARDVKMLIADPHVMPDVAIDDPTLTLSCPKGVTSSSGMDALTHAIEAYISKRANPISDVFALSAIRRISGHLRRAWAQGDDLEARSLVMLGSLEAGMAFVNSSVALVHGMARPVGAYFHVPHGLSNSQLLPTVMEFTRSAAQERFAQVAAAMGEDLRGLSVEEAAQRAVQAVRRLSEDLQIPSLSKYGVDTEKLMKLAPRMAQDALDSGSPANNPRLATVEEMVELYRKAL